MKYIFFMAIFTATLFGAMLKSPIISLDTDKAIIEIEKIDVGMSGYIVRELNDEHSTILQLAVVESFDATTKQAVLKLSKIDTFSSNNLPKGLWKTQAGDIAVFASGYKRALLLAPTEEIYYRITKAVPALQWIHPDLFATFLSYEGHPTPLKKDFDLFGEDLEVGLLYLYIDEKLYTLDRSSFTILDIVDAPLIQEIDALKLPFYSRVEEISANWFGEGSSHLEMYEPYYYKLMAKHNPYNKQLYTIIKDLQLPKILNEFKIKD
ncbi:MAG: plasminogen-binding N-terminal domain-containing protein [Sulfurimonadaceae bacterium]|nr:plasminogen-binding N-terminal domain-containing protein [Sulfurimonadaceae bacterium]